MRRITEIIIHCTATRPDWLASAGLAAKRAEVRRWHVEGNGWKDIGYHWLIDRDGARAEGRALELDGAHVQGRNRGTVGIALIGGHGAGADDGFARHFTPAQDRALRALIAELRSRFGQLALSGHNEHAAKGCPGFRVGPWFATGPIAAALPPPQGPGWLAVMLAVFRKLIGGR